MTFTTTTTERNRRHLPGGGKHWNKVLKVYKQNMKQEKEATTSGEAPNFAEKERMKRGKDVVDPVAVPKSYNRKSCRLRSKQVEEENDDHDATPVAFESPENMNFEDDSDLVHQRLLQTSRKSKQSSYNSSDKRLMQRQRRRQRSKTRSSSVDSNKIIKTPATKPPLYDEALKVEEWVSETMDLKVFSTIFDEVMGSSEVPDVNLIYNLVFPDEGLDVEQSNTSTQSTARVSIST